MIPRNPQSPSTPLSREPSAFWKAYQERHAPKAQTGLYPSMRDLFAVPLVILTVLIMVFSGLAGIYPILLFYALWMPQILVWRPLLLRPTREVLPLYILAGYCVASTAWSDYRTDTLHVALEFVSMIVCTVVIGRIVSLKALLKGITIGTALVLTAAFIHGGYSDEIFGSKNQVGLVAEIGFFTCVIFFFAKYPLWERILFSVFPSTISALCMVLSHSASSVASLGMAFGVSFMAYMLSKFPEKARKPLLIVSILSIVAIGSVGFYAGAQGQALEAMGKDSSLTGRTYLWGEGLKVGMESPILGHGYGAFWVPGRPEAEKYWFEFGIFGRTGFHFHNLFIQSFVDIGAIGFLMIAFLILSSCYRSFLLVIKEGANIRSVYFIGISFMILIRGFVEVDILGPFTLGGMLFYSLFPKIHLPSADSPVPQAPSRIGNTQDARVVSRRPT